MEGPLIRFGPDLRARLQANLAAHDRLVLADHGARAAAVAIAVVPGGDGRAGFVLTRRSSRLRAHTRQYALPGGRIDSGEAPVDTARREMREEVGLAVDERAVVGVLDDYPTRSGFVITPVVLWVDEPGDLEPHEPEVDHAYVIPLTELDRADSPRWVDIDESDKPVIQLPIHNRLIHAPTAAMLYQFREVAMHGRQCRTDGIEEPVWAWR